MLSFLMIPQQISGTCNLMKSKEVFKIGEMREFLKMEMDKLKKIRFIEGISYEDFEKISKAEQESIDECVKFYFELLSKDTIAAGASLFFDRPPTKLRCRKCSNTFSPDSLNWVCPSCGDQSIEIVSGRECHVSSIEVD